MFMARAPCWLRAPPLNVRYRHKAACVLVWLVRQKVTGQSLDEWPRPALSYAMRGAEKLHWMIPIGWLAILTAAGVGMVVFIAPVFEVYRGFAFWALMLPLAAIGALLLLFGRSRDNRS